MKRYIKSFTSGANEDIVDKIYDLYELAWRLCDDPKIDQILIDNGTSPDSRFIVDENTDVMQAYADLVDYIKNNVDPDFLNEGDYALVYGDEVEACDSIMASTDIGASDFTVIQEIYDDGYVYMTEENVEPVYTQEYDVSLAEVLAEYPEATKYALKGWTDETFKPGDIITKTHFANYIKFTVGDDQMYSDFKSYVAQHPEFNEPCRQIEVRINNPSCLPSGEEERRKQSEELGKRLGKMLGLGRY